MSRWGISGAPIPPALLYAEPIGKVCSELNFPPLFAYAIACRESILGEMNHQWKAATVVSGDGGHGLFQLTSWFPNPGWDDPAINAHAAVENWLLPDVQTWFRSLDQSGDDLVRAVAASFNAGIGGAIFGHRRGNVDMRTTDNYGAGVLAIYHNLLNHGTPVAK